MSGRTHGKPDERTNSPITGRTDRNWSEVSRTHKQMQSMIGPGLFHSEMIATSNASITIQ